MDTAKKLYVSSLSRIVLGFIQMGVAFFMMPFVLGKLGDEWYGIWVLVGSIGSYYFLMDLGLSSAVSRYVAYHLAQEEHDAANTVINTSLVIYSVLAVGVLAIAGGVALGAGLFIQDPGKLQIVREVLLISGLTLTLEFPFKAFVGIVQAKIRYDLLTVSHLTTLIMSTAAIYICLEHGFGIRALAWIAFVTTLISNVLFFLIARHLFRRMRVRLAFFSRGRVRELFGYSLWSYMIHIADLLRNRIDSFVIAAFLSPVYVTHYFIGARLVEYFSNMLSRATNMVTPVFTSYHAHQDFEQIRTKLLLLNRINVVLGVFGAGMIIVFGGIFIKLWMGSSYVDAYPVLVVLVVALTINFIMNPAVNVLYAISRHRYLAWASLAEGVANLVLSLLLTPRLGIIGCAIGTAIPLFINRLFVIPPYVCRQINLSVFRFYSDLLPATAFAAIYVLIASQTFDAVGLLPSYHGIVLSSLASCPLYIAIVVFLIFNRQERKLLFSFLPERVRVGCRLG